MENRKFLGTAVLVGMLTGHTKNGLNLINAPTLAKDAGIEVSESYEGHSDMPMVTVTVSQGKSVSHSLQGMLHYSTAAIPLIMPSTKWIISITFFNVCYSNNAIYCETQLHSLHYSVVIIPPILMFTMQ